MHSRLLRYELLILPLCSFVVGCGGPPTATPAAKNNASSVASNVESKDLEDWSITAATAGLSADPFRVDGFQLNPPSDFRYLANSSESGPYVWNGPIREDETYALLMIIVTPLPSEYANTGLEALMQDALGGIKSRRTNWSATPTELGTINDKTFARSSWSGEADSSARVGLADRKMNGVVYLRKHQGNAIQLMCQDVTTEDNKSLSAGEAAIKTLLFEEH